MLNLCSAVLDVMYSTVLYEAYGPRASEIAMRKWAVVAIANHCHHSYSRRFFGLPCVY